MKILSKKYLVPVVASVLLAACSQSDNKASNATVTAQDLQHHNWNLVKIDGEAIQLKNKEQAPRLEIGEKMMANGNAGCNNFFGQGELEKGKFRIEKMGMTMKMCLDANMDVEQAMSQTLSDWSDITVTKQGLELKGAAHTLTFELKDWVN
ncbi:META domain-containing protein [Vibrio hippocampi]|uniref:Heat shock protein HslJ n=1 Tax=Vibrio hippocampi TaxID=654686 RepID=A0ABM8ZHH3_9VIBR|nr:META domain-containing protein [Vibrio hippocampi]CAH0526146.1 Heat shock protein HslJ [Vibrio hippocampi]